MTLDLIETYALSGSSVSKTEDERAANLTTTRTAKGQPATPLSRKSTVGLYAKFMK